MKKAVFVMCLLLFALLMFGCTSQEEQTMKGFLTELYQVQNTDDFQAFVKKAEEYFKESNKDSVQKGLMTMDEATGAEVYKPFTSKYEKYCSEAALKSLIKNGTMTKYDQLAFEEDCQFFIKEIVLKQDKSKMQFDYTVKVEKKSKDGTTKLQIGEGTIVLNKEKQVDTFKLTTDLKDF